jgi:hypothetical protein
MRTATCLTLLAIGAIFAFAITESPSFLNIHVAGWVIMATGAAGLLLPRRGQGWLWRRIVLRRGTRGRVVGHIDETRTPSYVMLNPSALEAVQPEPPAVDDEEPPTMAEPDEDAERTAHAHHEGQRHDGEHGAPVPIVVDEEYLGE